MSEWRMRHEIELTDLANKDPLAALATLEKLAGEDVSIKAGIALHVAMRCLVTDPPLQPPKPVGRPPRSFEDRIEMLLDGKASIEGDPLRRAREERTIERCRAEYRAWENRMPPETPSK